MFNFFRIKKRKISLLFILIFNQFFLNAFAVNLKKINSVDLYGGIFNKQNKVLNTLIGERNNFEANNLFEDVTELENFVEETFNSNDFENLQNENKQSPEINTKTLESENNSNNKLNENQDVPKKEKNIPINSKKKIIIRRNNFKTGKPILMSTGACNSEEIKLIENFICQFECSGTTISCIIYLCLNSKGFKITKITDVTPIPHNGCRPPKRRRV